MVQFGKRFRRWFPHSQILAVEVLILGVNAINGTPQQPIDGFEPPAREEIPLTIENICLENLYPPVFPHIIDVPGDAPGRKFFVVEVDESAEAPHAIENSTRVYVRTGNAANPYELAQVETIIELLRRRENPTNKRMGLLRNIHLHGMTKEVPRLQVAICPVFPSTPLCTVADCWEFLRTAQYRGNGRTFFEFESLRRVENGVAAFVPENPHRGAEWGEVNCYGLISDAKQLTVYTRQWGGIEHPYLAFGDVFQNWVKIYMCSAAFFERTGFKGNILIEVKLVNMKGHSLPFIGFGQRHLDEFRSYDRIISATQILSAENLLASIESVTHQLFAQLCWAVWQSAEDFPSDILDAQSTASLRELRLIL